VLEETDLSHLLLLSEDLLEVVVFIIFVLNELRCNEVGCGTSDNVVSVDGSG
jgi:hypothetical protein